MSKKKPEPLDPAEILDLLSRTHSKSSTFAVDEVGLYLITREVVGWEPDDEGVWEDLEPSVEEADGVVREFGDGHIRDVLRYAQVRKASWTRLSDDERLFAKAAADSIAWLMFALRDVSCPDAPPEDRHRAFSLLRRLVELMNIDRDSERGFGRNFRRDILHAIVRGLLERLEALLEQVRAEAEASGWAPLKDEAWLAHVLDEVHELIDATLSMRKPPVAKADDIRSLRARLTVKTVARDIVERLGLGLSRDEMKPSGLRTR